jgi:hypothetical protein
MRFFLFILLLCSLAEARTQQTNHQTQIAKTKEELQKFWNDLQDAAAKKERKALETLYADEFVFIHANGQEDNKEQRIKNILSISEYRPAPMPSFDELYVYDNVAVLRARGANRGTTIFVKRNGIWQVMQVQSTPMPPERKTITLDAKSVQQYIGKYEQSPGVFTLITFENDTLRAKGMNRPQVAILPLSDSEFAVKDNVGVFTFYKDDKGVVTHYILRVREREIKGTKVE